MFRPVITSIFGYCYNNIKERTKVEVFPLQLTYKLIAVFLYETGIKNCLSIT